MYINEITFEFVAGGYGGAAGMYIISLIKWYLLNM